MPRKHSKAPNPGDLLFKNLFAECSADTSFERVAEGLAASCNNAERLLSDAQYLFEAGRLSSARFLLTTAREEIAKSYILVNTCRLDLEKHNSVLRRLCRAFYDHISKHAYLKVLEHPNIKSMDDAKDIWEIEVQRWWPAGPEDGEPDMPHQTYFDREFPLYIDYGDYDQCWSIPSNSDQNAYFIEMFRETPISKTKKLIELWKQAGSAGMCTPTFLAILNSVFKKHYIREGVTLEQLQRLYEQVAQRVEAEVGVSQESFLASALIEWPLYHCVS